MATNEAPRLPAEAGRGWRDKADTWTGLGAIALGLAMLYIGADYDLGRPGRIGPGYVPRLLAVLLCGLGLILLARAARAHDLVDADIAWQPLLLVIGGIVTFALLLDRAGLIVAIVATVIVAAPAAAGNSGLSVLVSGAFLAAFSWGLFVKALKISIPVWWF